MARPITVGAKDWRRIGRVVQEVEGAPQQSSHRRGRWPVASGQKAKSYIVTTVNCALDGFQLEEGVLFDDDARAYVECKPVKSTVTGLIVDVGVDPATVDPVRLYCDRQTRGFIHFGLIVQAVRIGGKLTVRETGNYSAWGEYVSQSLGLYTINLWANESDAADYEVSVPVTEKCESTGPNTVGQLVKVQWEWKPGAGNGGEPSLVIADWCCA